MLGKYFSGELPQPGKIEEADQKMIDLFEKQFQVIDKHLNALSFNKALIAIWELISAGNKVICVEPHIDSLEGYEIVDIDNALKKSDINIMLVCHDIFRKNKKISTNEKLLDFCGVIDN